MIEDSHCNDQSDISQYFSTADVDGHETYVAPNQSNGSTLGHRHTYDQDVAGSGKTREKLFVHAMGRREGGACIC